MEYPTLAVTSIDTNFGKFASPITGTNGYRLPSKDADAGIEPALDEQICGFHQVWWHYVVIPHLGVRVRTSALDSVIGNLVEHPWHQLFAETRNCTDLCEAGRARQCLDSAQIKLKALQKCVGLKDPSLLIYRLNDFCSALSKICGVSV